MRSHWINQSVIDFAGTIDDKLTRYSNIRYPGTAERTIPFSLFGIEMLLSAFDEEVPDDISWVLLNHRSGTVL